jgi:hypothetical protein
VRTAKIGIASVCLQTLVVLGGQQCPESIGSPPSIREVYDELQKVQRDNPEDFPHGEVPEAARRLLPQLKKKLRNLILATIISSSGEDEASLRVKIEGALREQGIPVGHGKLPGLYGGIHGVGIDRPPGSPDLLAATTTIGIPCGEDTSLYIFRQKGAHWALELAVEANDYPTINGAQESFGYAISRRNARGEWYVVTVHAHPWCTSCWNGITYQVFRPGPNPDAHRLLAKGSDGLYRCEDVAYKLRLVGDGFKINRVGAYGLDSGVFMGVYADRFNVTGDRVTRVPPVAYLPQDFLSRWVDFPWSEAVHWSVRANRPNLRLWHRRLGGKERYKDENYYYSTLEFVQPCDLAASKWQIGLSIDSQRRTDKLPETLFFTVIKKQGVFYLDRIGTRRPPGCPGEARPADSFDRNLRKQLMNQ